MSLSSWTRLWQWNMYTPSHGAYLATTSTLSFSARITTSFKPSDSYSATTAGRRRGRLGSVGLRLTTWKSTRWRCIGCDQVALRGFVSSHFSVVPRGTLARTLLSASSKILPFIVHALPGITEKMKVWSIGLSSPCGRSRSRLTRGSWCLNFLFPVWSLTGPLFTTNRMRVDDSVPLNTVSANTLSLDRVRFFPA